MPLPILLVLVVGGIGSIAVLMHILGLSKRKCFTNAAAARAVWTAEFPDDPAKIVSLSHDRHAALVQTSLGNQGIVWPMGADATARYLDGAIIAKTKSGLKIRLPDFTAPKIHLTLDLDEAKSWLSAAGKKP